jgi:hypothetical protein
VGIASGYPRLRVFRLLSRVFYFLITGDQSIGRDNRIGRMTSTTYAFNLPYLPDTTRKESFRFGFSTLCNHNQRWGNDEDDIKRPSEH